MPGMDGTGPSGGDPMRGGGRGRMRDLDVSAGQQGGSTARSGQSVSRSPLGTLLACGAQVVVEFLRARSGGRGSGRGRGLW